ncbi:MAG: GNAT family N-acetyltransferase [Bacteroides sp.]|nr:GNAT family N-acetyltransferase [Bacteroides sp.]
MIETERLILRPWREDDADDLFRYASDERVSKMALWQCHTSVEMSREVITQFFMPYKDTFAMTLREIGEVIGCIGLVPMGEEHYPASENEREVGYWIGYPHWNKGLTTEALKSFMQYCGNKTELHSILLTTDSRNKGSQRVAEKCGFVQFDRYDFDGIESLAYRKILTSDTIRSCSETDYPELIGIWERSVRSSHHFLPEHSILEIKNSLSAEYFPKVDLYGIERNGIICGFIGIAADKIEMLFIDDCHRGKGLGTSLINYAIALGATTVDVNEQNTEALKFYTARGFQAISRDDYDDAGRPYPILHLALS